MDERERAEQDRFRLAGGQRAPSSLPPHLKRLHRRIQRQAREDRQIPHTDERWPGLVPNPEEQE